MSSIHFIGLISLVSLRGSALLTRLLLPKFPPAPSGSILGPPAAAVRCLPRLRVQQHTAPIAELLARATQEAWQNRPRQCQHVSQKTKQKTPRVSQNQWQQFVSCASKFDGLDHGDPKLKVRRFPPKINDPRKRGLEVRLSFGGTL